MPSGRPRFWTTLRFQLAAWNSLVLFGVMAVTLLAVRESVRIALWGEADKHLVEDAQEVRSTIAQLHGDLPRMQAELTRKTASHTHRILYVRIYDGHLIVWSTANAPVVRDPSNLGVPAMTPVSVGPHRLVHFPLDGPGQPAWTVRVATSFEPLESTLTRLSWLMLAVGGGLLLLTPLGGYWLAGRATAPLAEIVDRTSRLRPTQSAERLPLRGTGDELDGLSATINQLLDRIAADFKQNQEFTANAAHQLRSPLAAIQSTLEVGLNTDRSIAEYQDLLGVLLDECERLRVLVNHLLFLAESDAGRLDVGLKPVPFDRLVEQSCDMFHALAEAENIRLTLTQCVPSTVRGHGNSLRQVCDHLLDNAVKYTPAGGSIDVSLEVAATQAVLHVRDTGIGIAPEDVPHVFRRFYRGDRARSRTTHGSGLGLCICQSIVKAHGGEITLDSAVGTGTTVTVRLPIDAAADVEPLQEVPQLSER